MLGFVILFLESNESFKKPQKAGRSFHHLTENQAVSLSKCETKIRDFQFLARLESPQFCLGTEGTSILLEHRIN